MSFIPHQELCGRNLIAHFVIDKREKGAFLPYSEYQFIDAWLNMGTEDELLLILEELLPKLYSRSEKRSYPRSLARIDKQVQTKLHALKKRQNF